MLISANKNNAIFRFLGYLTDFAGDGRDAGLFNKLKCGVGCGMFWEWASDKMAHREWDGAVSTEKRFDEDSTMTRRGTGEKIR